LRHSVLTTRSAAALERRLYSTSRCVDHRACRQPTGYNVHGDSKALLSLCGLTFSVALVLQERRPSKSLNVIQRRPKHYNNRLMTSFWDLPAWVSWYQKGRTILDFNEARDDGVAVALPGPYANHLRATSLQTNNYNTSTPSLNFYGPDPPNQQCQSSEGLIK